MYNKVLKKRKKKRKQSKTIFSQCFPCFREKGKKIKRKIILSKGIVKKKKKQNAWCVCVCLIYGTHRARGIVNVVAIWLHQFWVWMSNDTSTNDSEIWNFFPTLSLSFCLVILLSSCRYVRRWCIGTEMFASRKKRRNKFD